MYFMFSAVHLSLNFITYHLLVPLSIMSQSKISTFSVHAAVASCGSGSSKRRKEGSKSQSDSEPGTDIDGSGSGDEGQDDTVGGIDCSTIADCSPSSYDPDLVRATCTLHPKTPSDHGTLRVAVHRQGKQSRLLCSSWFGEHKWLTFCSTREKVFCMLLL